jgi:uncharacterized protein YdeI (YjbR/CyaY-like superfamily)
VSAAFFATPEEFGAWLEEHHDSERELIVGFYKKGSGKQSITWPESVEQALRFGWIDGVRRRLDDQSYTIRFVRPQGRARALDGFEERLRATPADAEWFYGQAPYSHRRTAIHWVTSAKRPETRERPLAAGRLLGRG